MTSDVPIDVSRVAIPTETLAAIPPRWRSLTSAVTQVRFAARYLNHADVTRGHCWALGLSLFVDEEGLIVKEVTITHRFEAVPHMLEAFAAGFAAKLRASQRVWSNVEQLVPHAAEVPEAFVSILASACSQQHSRAPAIRIAARIGARAHDVLAAARDSARGKNRARLSEAIELVARPPTRPILDELLERAVEVWRDTGDSELVPLITAIGREVAYRRGPCRSGDEEAWGGLARALDPGDLDRLLDCPWPTGYASEDPLRERLSILGARPADPRTVRLREVARAHAWPPRLADEAERLAARGEPPQHARARPALVGELRAAITPLTRRDELFAQCAAHPEDVARLAVLADHLLELGDPRGEVIALELAGKPTGAVTAAHAARWMPPIDGAEAPVIERGVIVELHITPSAKQLQCALDHPAWTWIQRLRVHAPTPRPFDPVEEPVAIGPLLRRMPALRDLVVHSVRSLRRLEGSHPLRRLEWRHYGDGVFDASWLPDRAAFPELEVLAVPSGARAAEHLFARARALGLRVLTLVGPWDVPGPADRALGPELLRITPTHNWWVELPREGDHAYLFGPIAMKWQDFNLAALMPALAGAGFRRLSIHASTGLPGLPCERDGLSCDRFEGPLDTLAP